MADLDSSGDILYLYRIDQTAHLLVSQLLQYGQLYLHLSTSILSQLILLQAAVYGALGSYYRTRMKHLASNQRIITIGVFVVGVASFALSFYARGLKFNPNLISDSNNI